MTLFEKTEQRKGRKTGKIDAGFDVNKYGLYPNRPEGLGGKLEMLIEIERLLQAGKKIKVTYEGGFTLDLVDVGMYVGFPFWEPTPAFALKSWYGQQWLYWYQLINYEIVKGE